MVLCQPRPPLSAAPNLQRYEFCRHAACASTAPFKWIALRPQVNVKNQSAYFRLALNVRMPTVGESIVPAASVRLTLLTSQSVPDQSFIASALVAK